MRTRLLFIVICSLLITVLQAAFASAMKPGEFLVLCYHAVPVQPEPGDTFSISQKQFVEQIEYLHTHGYHPVSFKDIVGAANGKKPLPDKPVLLTFDDGYVSYHDFVVPLLEDLGYPSVLAIIGNTAAYSRDDIPEDLMSWEQIRAVSSKKLVEVISHSYDLHRPVQYTPQGNVAPAFNVRAYDPDRERYETASEYKLRIENDFRAQAALFRKELGFVPDTIAWPFGKYNDVTLAAARRSGIKYSFNLEEGYAQIQHLDLINRVLIENAPINEFIQRIARPEGKKAAMRAVQVDLDLIVDAESMQKTDENLGKLIDRLAAMNVNTVFLQAFADTEGTGNIESVYFSNRVLPVRADIFGWAAHQIMIRDMAVYAWMPTLSIVLPDRERTVRLRVRETKDGGIKPAASWYKRLSPFSKEVRELTQQLYEDLAAHAQFTGVLFQDDAYLTDQEDFHPAAVKAYTESFGSVPDPAQMIEGTPGALKWARFKTEALIDFTDAMKQRVRTYRPNAIFARNLYAPLMMQPGAEQWFAQDYKLFLDNYDFVVVMAYPEMEGIGRPLKWLGDLVGRAQDFPHGIEKTIFKLQSYNWKKEEWIDSRDLLSEMREILSTGGRHLAYYPDNVWEDRPLLDAIKLEMSTKTYPFMP
jgi:biofilm PGA synthesis lipoprotein PgaB